jgi:diaminopimelate decarboxylase
MDTKIVHFNVTVGENGHLYFAGADTVALAEKYGTPVFLLDDARVRARVREYKEAMARNFGEASMPLFASKALSFKEI